MPKLKDNQVPAYGLHKQSGQAVVTLNGRDMLLGKFGSVFRSSAGCWGARGSSFQWLGLDDLGAFSLRRIEARRWHVSVYFLHDAVETR